MLEYKGYIAEFAYDDIVELYSRRVINSGPYSIVTVECEHEEDLTRILKEAIDDYLAWCAEDGVEPVKPHTHTT